MEKEMFIESYKGYGIYMFKEYIFFYYMIKNSEDDIVDNYLLSKRAAKIRITNLIKKEI